METHRRCIPPAVLCWLLVVFVTSRPGAAPAAPIFPDMLHAFATGSAGWDYPNGDNVRDEDHREGYSSAATSVAAGGAWAWCAAGPGQFNSLALLRGGVSGSISENGGGLGRAMANWYDYIVLDSPRTVRLTFAIDGQIARSGAGGGSVELAVSSNGGINGVDGVFAFAGDPWGNEWIQSPGWDQIGYDAVDEGVIAFHGQQSLSVAMGQYGDIYCGDFFVTLLLQAGSDHYMVGAARVDVGNTVTLTSATYEDTGLPVGPEGHFDSGLPMPSAAAVPEPSTAMVWSLLAVFGLTGARRWRPGQKA
jgi:hypothetical protein